MGLIIQPNLDLPALPNLKKHFIFSTMVLVLLILAGQTYQDYYHKQEQMDAQRLHIYQKQAALNHGLIINLLAIRDSNAISIDFHGRQFLDITKNLMVLQSKLNAVKAQRHLSQNIERLSKEELLLATHVDNILLTANEVLALAESGRLDDYTAVSSLYQQMLPDYKLYDAGHSHLIEKLSNLLQTESYEHRMMLWLVVGIFLLLLIALGGLSYLIVAELIHRQIQLVEQDNQRSKESEQAMAEQAKVMHDQQMKMRSILDHTVDSIITITSDGLIDSFNKTAESMFGYSATEVIGHNVALLMPENYAKEHDGYLKQYKDTGVRKVIGIGREMTAQRKDQSQFPIYLSVSEVPESQPRIFTGIIKDMTEWKNVDEKLEETLQELRNKQAQLEEEEKIARHVFENITANNNDDLPELSSWIVPMGTFSGDMMLSAVLPSGATRVLLCDFTGHGLPAALGAVPVSSVHKAMAGKDMPLEVLMEELNNKLKALLPTGIFCCIAGVDIDATRTHAYIWNGGLPEVLLVSKTGEIKKRIKSEHLPLGVMTYDRSELRCVDVPLQSGDSIYIYSDGITESENPAGEMFGQQRFEALLTVAVGNGDRMESIKNRVNAYINNAPANDDLSLLQIKTLVMADEIILKS